MAAITTTGTATSTPDTVSASGSLSGTALGIDYFGTGAEIEVSVAWSFPATSNPADGDYTDETANVRNVIQTNRGRSTERDSFQAGSLTITFDNRDRRYDPDYSSGPLFGVLLPMRHIRVRLIEGGETAHLFHGFIRGWPQTWEQSNNDGTVTVVANDAFSLFARTKLPESAWAHLVKLGTVANAQAWYRLGDPDGTTRAIDAQGTAARDATYSDVSTLVAGLPSGAVDGARQVTGTAGTSIKPILYDAYAPATGTTFTVLFWLQIPETVTSGYTQWLWLQGDRWANWDNVGGPGEAVPSDPTGQAPTTAKYVRFGLNTSTKQFVYAMSDGTTTGSGNTLAMDGTQASFPDIFDGERHMISLVRNGSTLNVYVDGVGFGWASTTGSISAGSVNYGARANVGVFREDTWVMDEVVVYNSAVTSGQATLYEAGDTAYADETVAERIDRVIEMCDVGVPVSLEVSQTTVKGCDFGGGFLLDYLLSLWQTEGGQSRLFMSADGTLTFQNRFHDTQNPTVVTAFSDVAGSTLPYSDILYDGIDDARIHNTVTVTREDGTPQQVVDATSVDTYGTIGLDISGLKSQSDPACLSYAQAVVLRYKDPQARIRGLAVKPRAAPATLFPKMRTTEIGTRVSVRRLPVGVGSAWTKELTIEGVAHSISARGEWVATYLTAPVDSTAWAIVGNSTTGKVGVGKVSF